MSIGDDIYGIKKKQTPFVGVKYTSALSYSSLDDLSSPTVNAASKKSGVVGNQKQYWPEGVNSSKEHKSSINDDVQDSSLLFKVPDWGYQDFLTERASFVKGFESPTGEIGWFYFKVFFRFDTDTGLLGSCLDETIDIDNPPKKFNGDSAIGYLLRNVNHYSKAHFKDRAKSLRQFARTLSFINSKAPWFFESVGGLSNASVVDFSNPMANRVIELGFKEDAVDMRVTSLIDLYKYACYDYINLKEVVPQNLRFFDMTIVLFHSPLRWYHTGMQTMKRGTFQYKSLNAENPDDRMTYKMYTFHGCEFVHESLANMYPSDMSNENAFNLAKARVQISYKRVYQHTFNEWSRFFIGDDGVYWEDSKNNSSRLLAIVDAAKNPYYYNPGADVFKALVDASESRINWALRQAMPRDMFGNLYLDYTDPYGDYAKMKLKDLHDGTDNGEATNHIVSSLNDEGIFRNTTSALRDAENAIHGFVQGNFV